MSSSSLSPLASLSSSPPSSLPPLPNVSKFILSPPPKELCFVTTPKRKYYKKDNWFAKRCLRPLEYWTSPRGLIVPRAGKERIKNEAASLQFISDKTNIPVPKVYGAFELNGAFWLITEYIEGVDLALLPKEKQLPVLKELEGHLETLRSLKSNSVRGPTGIIVPPYRITHATKQDFWNLRPSPTMEYVFCYNDLSQHNVIVDPETLKIKAIINWEYAGFYPSFFKGRFYTRLGPSDALEKYNEKSDTSKLLEFLESLHTNS